MGSEVGGGAVPKRHSFSGVELRLRLCGVLGLYRVYSVDPEMPLLASLLAGLGERDGMSRAKPHLAHAALVYAIAVNPGLPALCDLQVKPTTIGIHTRCFDCLDLACGQLVELGH